MASIAELFIAQNDGGDLKDDYIKRLKQEEDNVYDIKNEIEKVQRRIADPTEKEIDYYKDRMRRFKGVLLTEYRKLKDTAENLLFLGIDPQAHVDSRVLDEAGVTDSKIKRELDAYYNRLAREQKEKEMKQQKKTSSSLQSKSHLPKDRPFTSKGIDLAEDITEEGSGNRIKSMLKYMDKYIVEKLKMMGVSPAQAKRKAKSSKAEQLKNELVLKMMKANSKSMKGGMKAMRAKKAPKKKVSAKQKQRYAMIRKIMNKEHCSMPEAQMIIKKYKLMD